MPRIARNHPMLGATRSKKRFFARENIVLFGGNLFGERIVLPIL